MLSIIICSVNSDHLSQIKKNIADTVGIPHEVIAIDNNIKPRGITAVYNEGARKAKFNNLCFVHEDVEFKSSSWGQKCTDILKDPSIGIVGIAGGGYKALTPSGWHCEELPSPLKSFQYLIQGYKFKDQEEFFVEHNPMKETLSEVVAIDGVWFCTRKEVVEKYPFDEELLKHFHGYDVDFSLSVRKEYKIVVTYEILIKHLSEGSFDKKWLDTILILHTKWNAHLPAYLPHISEEMIFKTEKLAFKNLIDQMIGLGYSKKVILQVILNSYASPKMGLKLFSKIYFYYLKKTF
jgi:hypothetical protein